MGIQGMELCAMAVVVLLFIAVLKQFGILEPISMEGTVWSPPRCPRPGPASVGREPHALGLGTPSSAARAASRLRNVGLGLRGLRGLGPEWPPREQSCGA